MARAAVNATRHPAADHGMPKRPPTCPSCGSGEVRKSSAVVSQGRMQLDGRMTGVGINSHGTLSGQAGAIAATLSSDVVEKNTYRPNYEGSSPGSFLLGC